MLHTRVTLKDVAKRAGVHPSTASRALNSGAGRTSDATVERVLLAAAALGYEPDQVARALKTKRTFLIGVAVPDLLNAVFPAVVRGLETVLGEAGYIVILSNTDGDAGRERASVRAMISRQVDGLVLMTSQIKSNLVEELAGFQIPLVLIGRLVDDPAISAVACDDFGGEFEAVTHLASLGHSRIAHVGGPQDTSTGRDRFHGYVAGLREHGLEEDPALITMATAFDQESGAQAVRDLLGWTRDFTAITAASDAIAFGCLDALAEAGLSIPRDVSLVGFGGLASSLRTSPPLTTVGFSYDEIGRIGGGLLLAQLAGEDVVAGTVRVDGQLIVRGTTDFAGSISNFVPRP